ncbi:MAG: CBS domain-containing protein [Methanophagales archaeon]|nr:CBS domain-containing protein [Methanophagales archaeon]
MARRDFIFRLITDERVLVVIVSIAFLWRAFVSSDGEITLWESVCSGVSLFIIGWVLFGYLYSMSAKPTDWPVSNKIYHGIAVSLLVLNIYVMIYYGMRWVGLLHVEVSVPRDFIYRDLRYVLFVIFYCVAIGSARYLRGVHENYRLLIKERPKKRAKSIKEAIFRVATHERTLVVVIAAAILWRMVISGDNDITFWESTLSGISLIVWGWSIFGYFCALSVKVKRKPDLTRAIQGTALGLCAINIYAVLYYGLRWYGLIGRLMGEVEETCVPQPLDIVFRNVRYLMLVLFYCTIVLVAKQLVKAYEDYTVPARKIKEREVARFKGNKKNGRIKISGSFEITTFQKWCRIGLIFRFSESIKWYEYEPSLGSQFNKYRLSIADRLGNCLFFEDRSFMDFISLFKTTCTGRLWLGRYTATHKGNVAILEFIPPSPGRYELDFDLAADEVFSEPGHKRMTSFQELTLYVREGVEPMEGPAYPHKRVDLMKVRDIMTRPVIAEDGAALVTKIAEDMAELGIGSVVITSEGKPAGIITERDLALKVLLKNKRASEVKAKEIMSFPLITTGPETSVEEACELVAEKGVKRLPVVENDVLIGIVSIRNILTKKPRYVKRFYPEVRVLASRCKQAVRLVVPYFLFRTEKRSEIGELKVREIMTRPVIAEDEETLVTTIAKDMNELGIGSIVITRKGKPSGIITERDLALKVLLKDRKASEVNAKEIMAFPLVTIEPEASVDEVCKLAVKKRIKRLPVVENGSLVGIVSIRDLLRWKPEYVREFYF